VTAHLCKLLLPPLCLLLQYPTTLGWRYALFASSYVQHEAHSQQAGQCDGGQHVHAEQGFEIFLANSDNVRFTERTARKLEFPLSLTNVPVTRSRVKKEKERKALGTWQSLTASQAYCSA
jgi:hypothetical protein